MHENTITISGNPTTNTVLSAAVDGPTRKRQLQIKGD